MRCSLVQTGIPLLLACLCIPVPVSAQASTGQMTMQDVSIQVDSVARYRDLIQELEVENGPYHDSLSEPLISLGRALKASGQYPDARQVLLRAQQNVRVNNGLYDPGQIPIVNMLIESSAAVGNWTEVDDSYHQLLWLHERAYSEDDRKLFHQIGEQINWHKAALNFTSGKQSATHLLELRDLYARGTQILEDEIGQDEYVLAQWLYKQMLVNFYIAITIKKGRESGAELLEALASHDMRFGYIAASEALLDKYYDAGIEVFNDITKIYSRQTGFSESWLATLYIYQADWNLLFNKPEKALELYELSSELLIQSGVPDTIIQDYYSRPVVLPLQELIVDYPMHTEMLRRGQLFVQERESIQQATDVSANTPLFLGWSDELPGVGMPVSGLLDIAPPNTEEHAVAVFNVNETGWPENIDILSYRPEKFTTRNRAYNTVWAIQFRPVLQQGKAVRTMDATLSVVLPR